MLTIGIGEIQKKISIFNNLNQIVKIIDKRKKETLAFVYPVKRSNKVDKLAGKYKDRVEKNNLNFKEIKEEATLIAMREKYDLST